MRNQDVLQRTWLAPPELLMLKNDEVHVWRISLEMTPHQVRMLEQLLSADELEKAERFYFQKDKDHFIVARGMLRLVLARYLEIEPSKLLFRYGPYGKPFLAGETGGKSIRFNVSHSRGLALVAVAREREIGVDLEHILSYRSVRNIAEQFFSRQEADTLNALPEHVRPEMFFALWTRKEACLKAQGKGLAVDLNMFDVSSIQRDPRALFEIIGNSPEATPWSLKDLDVGPSYAGALAAEGNDWILQCWQWDYSYPYHVRLGGAYTKCLRENPCSGRPIM